MEVEFFKKSKKVHYSLKLLTENLEKNVKTRLWKILNSESI